MNEKTALVVTSIASPNDVLKQLAKGCNEKGWQFIVIGDEASPDDFHIDGCDFYSLERQRQTGFEIAKLAPTRHYTRKNIGYLIAIENGASIIVETDDDNIPLEGFWSERNQIQPVKTLKNGGWTNVYKYFSDLNIWPRGLSLNAIKKPLKDYDSLEISDTNCPVQQGLSDNNPDVDALYRLILPIPVYFRNDRRVALADGSVCPFNSQNTTWFTDSFGLLYLPAFSSFRMTDIWRSLVAQRIAWANDWAILFQEATTTQERNEHDLMRDFADEVPGYLNNDRLFDALNSLAITPGADNIAENLAKSYKTLVEMDLLNPKELALVNAWNNDLKKALNGRNTQ
jgi:hypothetical protein